ncbi:MAG: hypothetical protein ACR2GL_00855 [Thermoleophilaceae bacterium]
MMVGARGPLLFLSGLLVTVLLGILALELTGENLGELWVEIALPVTVLGASLALLALMGVGCSARRVRNRRRRPMARYQLVLAQADEATFEEVGAACEQLVQTLRQSLTRRLSAGQPWLALESWFLAPRREGETGTATLMLLCEPRTRDPALAALRRAYPDLTLRPGAHGEPFEYAAPSFVPGHVLRVRRARSWALPLGSAGRGRDGSSARATMAGVIRQQQQAGRLSCVRWCITPAADQLDSRAAERLARLGVGDPPSPALTGDFRQALESAGGAMSYLELQAAVERGERRGPRGKVRPESFGELQNVCRQLLSPALSHRGANHFSERLMVFRQGLYARRFARGEPPLLPDPSGSTLVSPRELGLLMELPSLGSEHALPLQRNTVPHLPIPTEVPRAKTVELAMAAEPAPNTAQTAIRDAAAVEVSQAPPMREPQVE